jgi:hypothetical protein
MIVEIKDSTLLVTREAGDKRLTRSGYSPNAGLESALLHRVQQALNSAGFDLVKTLMWKDGHLVDENVQYLRTKNKKAKNGMVIWNGNYQIWDAGEDYEENGRTYLIIDGWGKYDRSKNG